MNYNIKMDLLKFSGARVEAVGPKKQKCVCIPLAENVGTIELSGESCYLSLAAFELKERANGQSHLVKPSLSRAQLRKLTIGERLELPFVGNMRPWFRDTAEVGAKADITKCRKCEWGSLLSYASGSKSIRCEHPGAPIETTRDVHYINCPKTSK